MDGQNILTFVVFFFTGLAVNLTPCVYPMLTVTVSLFKPQNHSKGSIRSSFSKALVYVLGMALMYSILGYFAASTGKLFGAALQSRWVLGGVALMMFALGLSMLGVFQFAVPSELLNRLSKLRKANYLGLFVSGMLVGIFAAPCIGPPVLALLAAVTNNGDPGYGFLAFFVFSLGLGLPYLVLGTFSSLMTKLPKAGAWLIWVERTFGIFLLGFGVFYLALALQWQSPNKTTESLWQTYTQEKFKEVVSQKKPVIIDFYADWCLGCHELDRYVFSHPEIKVKLAQVTTFRVDATQIDDPLVSALIEQYGIVGLPTVLFLDGHGKEIRPLRVEGAQSAREFNLSLDRWAIEVGVYFEKPNVK